MLEGEVLRRQVGPDQAFLMRGYISATEECRVASRSCISNLEDVFKNAGDKVYVPKGRELITDGSKVIREDFDRIKRRESI
jgi:hypothetical protein